MRKKSFDDFGEFACEIVDTYESLKSEDYEDVAIVAKYEEMRKVIKELLCFGYNIHSVDFHDEEYEGYDSEYICSLYDDEIWCEPMLRENGYITDDSPVMYILDNCSSKVIPYCKGKTVFEVTVGDEECDCGECECACKKDEKPTTTTSATYKVNGKEVDKETYEKALNELDEKYLDNVQDMLLNYFDFVNEMNQWRKLLGW